MARDLRDTKLNKISMSRKFDHIVYLRKLFQHVFLVIGCFKKVQSVIKILPIIILSKILETTAFFQRDLCDHDLRDNFNICAKL